MSRRRRRHADAATDLNPPTARNPASAAWRTCLAALRTVSFISTPRACCRQALTCEHLVERREFFNHGLLAEFQSYRLTACLSEPSAQLRIRLKHPQRIHQRRRVIDRHE